MKDLNLTGGLFSTVDTLNTNLRSIANSLVNTERTLAGIERTLNDINSSLVAIIELLESGGIMR